MQLEKDLYEFCKRSDQDPNAPEKLFRQGFSELMQTDELDDGMKNCLLDMRKKLKEVQYRVHKLRTLRYHSY